MHAAVARLAESAYARLAKPQREVAQSVMLRLATEQDGALSGAGRPSPSSSESNGANPVVAALIDARLLTLSDGRIELSHEALLREWPRYRTWLEEDRAGRRLHAHLHLGRRASGRRGIVIQASCTAARGWSRPWTGPASTEIA